MAMSSADNLSAVDAYVAFLARKQLDEALIAQRKQFVSEVAKRLANQPRTRETYADALHKLMHQPNHQAWLFDVTVAREFYPFWMQDFKAIASLSIDTHTIDWQPLPTTLSELYQTLSEARMNEQESLLLERYMLTLRQCAVEREQRIVRLRLAKILLLRLRDAPVVSNVVYRMAVDVTLPVFRQKKSRQLFLLVVREFFGIWMQSALKN